VPRTIGGICSNHPSIILSVRKACKDYEQLSTDGLSIKAAELGSSEIVWGNNLRLKAVAFSRLGIQHHIFVYPWTSFNRTVHLGTSAGVLVFGLSTG
jgi:hypothetical protein